MRLRAITVSFRVGVSLLALTWATSSHAQSVRDPGPRAVTTTEPTPISGLTDKQLELWKSSRDKFNKNDTVKDDGLGPTFNLDSCRGCHAHPVSGGSSPPQNPQYIYWRDHLQRTNKLPPFITADGPTREARYKRNPDGTADGGVHDLFTIEGLPDAGKCAPTQSDFESELRDKNVIFRIPTPAFGLGLIEQIRDQDIIDNHSNMRRFAIELDIDGKLSIINTGHTNAKRVNRNGNDGTVARFGWKAQNKSLLVFSGEAYNVEMGITNELFQSEREESPNCQNVLGTPNDTTNADPKKDDPNAKDFDVLSDIEKFAIFMRFLAPPTPSTEEPGGAASIASGKEVFSRTGCAFCHTPTLRTGISKVAALSNKEVNLYSDLVLHNMGRGLEDGISQGAASGNEFRTAPLWGLGQRLYFLHDGRTKDLVEAIHEHKSTGSESNKVVDRYDALPDQQKKDLLNFLRSL